MIETATPQARNEDSGITEMADGTILIAGIGNIMDPLCVLRLARQFGDVCPRILLVGCEPAEFGGADGSMELSQPVEAAVNEACALVLERVAQFLREKESILSAGPVGIGRLMS